MVVGGDRLGDSWTAREIGQQPATWPRVAREVDHRRADVDRLLDDALIDPATRVVLTGAGTSGFVGEVLAPELTRHLGRPVEAWATTDVVADPAGLGVGQRPVLLVSFARSGDSPESVAAADLVARLAPSLHHLVITCNLEGGLARRWTQEKNAVVVGLPPECQDRGFAMTSSFTGMLLATLLAFRVEVDLDALATAGAAVLDAMAGPAREVAAMAPARLVYLGSGALKGLARESALKCLELTGGDVVGLGESSMGFRHGPKAVLDDRTVAVVYLSGEPYTRAYDQDIARELVGALGGDRVVVIDAADPGGDPGTGTTGSPATGSGRPVAGDHGARGWPVPRPAGWPDAVWALVAVIPAQAIALACSLAAGRTPDNPFPAGEVNRVVRGVTIHELADQGRD